MPGRAQDPRLRELLDTLDLGTSMARDFCGVIRYWSQGCRNLYGWTAEEAVGQVSHDLLRTRFPVPLVEIEDAIRSAGEWSGELIHTAKDGREIVVLARKVLRIGEDGREILLEAITDMTQQRRAERALADSEARLRLALDAGGVFVFGWDPAKDELDWDDRSRATWGFASGERVTLKDMLARMHPDDRGPVMAAVDRSLDPASGGEYQVEYRIAASEGRPERWMSAKGRFIFEGGKASRMLGTVVDVTAVRQAEAVLARDKADLEKLVELRTEELRSANDRLAHAQKMEALGQLAGGIAHDFNNVLQAVQGAGGLIERKTSEPDIARLSRMVVEAAGRGSAITRRLLAFSRRGHLKAEPIDTERLMAGLREILDHTLGAEYPVSLVVQTDMPALMADKSQLETVLVNLATNARDAMSGGGAIELAAALEVVHPLAAPSGSEQDLPVLLQPGPYVRIAVADHGRGMTADVLARATEPFFTTKDVGQGTGLGLAMARGFAEQSGGALSIQSFVGQGTTVTLWLPVASSPPAPAILEQEVAGKAGGSRARILLVDDDPLVRDLTAEHLSDAGYDVFAAANGDDALAALDAGERVQILLTDLSMPGMDGIELIRRTKDRLPELPAILITGFANRSVELAEARKDVAFALLYKPVSSSQLVGQVAAALTPASD